jgi:hypothetical protein
MVLPSNNNNNEMKDIRMFESELVSLVRTGIIQFQPSTLLLVLLVNCQLRRKIVTWFCYHIFLFLKVITKMNVLLAVKMYIGKMLQEVNGIKSILMDKETVCPVFIPACLHHSYQLYFAI